MAGLVRGTHGNPQVFSVDITPFLAGAGIAGLAVALAAQDIISNFFGGAIITVDKPFKVGDRIKVDQYYGDVLAVGPRSTRLRPWITRSSPSRTTRSRPISL